MFRAGSTGSPRLYLASICWRSSSGLCLSGCAFNSISRRVATSGVCLVSLTGARQAGQVKTEEPGAGGEGAFSAAVAWQLNHSFKQAPQKVWRQSNSVRG